MKNTELRIGNYIASGKTFSEISSIGEVIEIGNDDRDFEQIYCQCEESFDWFFKDNYCGIPLTEEWLLKFGFIKDEDLGDMVYYQMPEKKRGYGVCFDHDEIVLYHYNILGITNLIYGSKHFQNVHQLQNLIFALTGGELTIKKEVQ